MLNRVAQSCAARCQRPPLCGQDQKSKNRIKSILRSHHNPGSINIISIRNNVVYVLDVRKLDRFQTSIVLTLIISLNIEPRQISATKGR